MEPSDLKPTPPDDALEAWLHRSAALPPLPDDGFSGRVLAALPPPRRTRAHQRIWICLAGAFAGTALAGFKLVTATEAPAAPPGLSLALERLADPNFAIAVAVVAATLLVAFWTEVRQRVPWRELKWWSIRSRI